MRGVTPPEGTPLRGVMIGAGEFAAYHLDAWTRLPGVRITAVGDLDPIRADDLAQRHGVSARFTDWREMIDAQSPDFVDVVTPPQAHAEQCRGAAARGAHIICQQPLTPSVGESAALIEEFADLPVRLMVHENWRWQPWYRRAHELLAGHAIGEPTTLSFRMRTGETWAGDPRPEGVEKSLGAPEPRADDPADAQAPVPRDAEAARGRQLLRSVGVHFVDAFSMLLGRVTSVYARTHRSGAGIAGEDAAIVVLGFEDGATAMLDASRYNESTAADPMLTFGVMRIDGSRGHLLLDADGRLTIHPLGGIPEPVDLDIPETGFAGDAVYATQRHFVESLRSGLPFETEAGDHLACVEIIEAAYVSAASGRAITLR